MYRETPRLNPEEIIMYLRKSRADDPLLTTEEVLANHESMLDEWCDRNLPYPIPQENRYKEVVSGESISDRLEFQKVLKLAESPSIKAIMVKEISRLGRPDKQEIGYISKVLRFTNTMVITPTRTFNIADEFERKMFEQELEQGNFYLEYNKRILKAGRDLASKKGAYLNLAPYGYDKTYIYDGKKKMSTLAINEEQANVVRMVFNWYVNENIGTQTIANRLMNLNIKPPKINVWKPEAVRDILENPIYIGMIRWNTRKGLWIVEDGEFRKTRPINKGEDRILVKGLHDPIISEELFNLAQEKRGRSHRTCDNKELKNPLASLLYCKCGRAMTYRHSTRGNLKYRPPVLVCTGQNYCESGSIRVDEMMDMVADALRKKIKEFEITVKNTDNKSLELQEKMVKNLEKKLLDIDAREMSLWESQVDPNNLNRMPPHIFQALNDKIKTDRDNTKAALEKVKAELSTPIDYEQKIVTFQRALDALLDDKVSVAEKNDLLKKCIRRIEYQRDKPTRMLGKGVGRQWILQDVNLDINFMV